MIEHGRQLGCKANLVLPAPAEVIADLNSRRITILVIGSMRSGSIEESARVNFSLRNMAGTPVPLAPSSPDSDMQHNIMMRMMLCLPRPT